MKIKTIIMLGVCAATSANAEVTVLPYTILDASASRVSNVVKKDGDSHARTEVRTNGGYGSRWGVRTGVTFGEGQELFARYEQGIVKVDGEVKTGLDERYLRLGHVGYKSSLGTIRYGQDLGISYLSLDYDPLIGRLVSSSSQLYFRDDGFVSNAFSYDSPTLSNFSFSLQHSGEQESRGFVYGTKKTYGASLKYENEPFSGRIGFDEQQSPDGELSNLFSYSKFAYAAGLVNLGRLTLMGGYSQLNAPDAAVAARKADHLWFGGKYQFTPKWSTSLSVYDTNIRDSGRATMLGGIVEYGLNKYITLWTSAGYLVNSDKSAFAINGLDSPSVGNNQTSVGLGMTFIYQ